MILSGACTWACSYYLPTWIIQLNKENCFRKQKYFCHFLKCPSLAYTNNFLSMCILWSLWYRSEESSAVWPDGKIKSLPIFPQFVHKVDTEVFTLKVTFAKWTKFVAEYLSNFCEIIFHREFSKWPNLVTLVIRDQFLGTS